MGVPTTEFQGLMVSWAVGRYALVALV